MLNQLLASFSLVVEDGLLTLLLGLLVTFLGILIIVLLVKLVGCFFVKGASSSKKQEIVEQTHNSTCNEDIPDHVKVAIIAAITAYYSESENKTKSDFIVRRIKRI